MMEVTKIECVQGFAAKVVSRRWRDHGADIVSDLELPLLGKRRSFLKLRKILESSSAIPETVFEWSSKRNIRQPNSLQLVKPFVRSSYHQASFFISMISLWNQLPEDLVQINKFTTFKRRLKKAIWLSVSLCFHAVYFLVLI